MSRRSTRCMRDLLLSRSRVRTNEGNCNPLCFGTTIFGRRIDDPPSFGAFSCLLGLQPSDSDLILLLSPSRCPTQAATVAFDILPSPRSAPAIPDGRVAQARSQPASVIVARGPLAAPAWRRSDGRTPHRPPPAAVLPRTRGRTPRARRPDTALAAFRETAVSSPRSPLEKWYVKKYRRRTQRPPYAGPPARSVKSGTGGESQKTRRLPESRSISYSERPPADTAQRFLQQRPRRPIPPRRRPGPRAARRPCERRTGGEKKGYLAKPGDRPAHGTVARP